MPRADRLFLLLTLLGLAAGTAHAGDRGGAMDGAGRVMVLPPSNPGGNFRLDGIYLDGSVDNIPFEYGPVGGRYGRDRAGIGIPLDVPLTSPAGRARPHDPLSPDYVPAPGVELPPN